MIAIIILIVTLFSHAAHGFVLGREWGTEQRRGVAYWSTLVVSAIMNGTLTSYLLA